MSSTTVGYLLHALGYRLQALRKIQEGKSHPDRNAQLEHINAAAAECLHQQQPVISVSKKTELVGDFENAGREWQPTGTAERVRVHDFPSDAVGKAIPYGVYDMARNEARVGVGRDHDTPAFAVGSIRQWWTMMGRAAYPHATALLITADAEGSNGYRLRTLKQELQRLADDLRLPIHVSHFPRAPASGTRSSIGCFVTLRRTGGAVPLRTLETVVDVIGHTRTATGLRVKAKLDKRRYPTGRIVTRAEMQDVALHPHAFHNDWNYRLRPRPS